jgi:hypothetical protein
MSCLSKNPLQVVGWDIGPRLTTVPEQPRMPEEERTERVLEEFHKELGGVIAVYQRHDFEAETPTADDLFERWSARISGIVLTMLSHQLERYVSLSTPAAATCRCRSA